MNNNTLNFRAVQDENGQLQFEQVQEGKKERIRKVKQKRVEASEHLGNLIKLSRTILIALIFLMCCFEKVKNTGIFGKYTNQTLMYLFGETRYLVPLLLIAFAIINFFVEFRNLRILAFTLSLIGGNFCMFATLIDKTNREMGGMVGKLLYFTLGQIIGDGLILFISGVIIACVYIFLIRLLVINFKAHTVAVSDVNNTNLFAKMTRMKGDIGLLQDVFNNYEIDAKVKKTIKGLMVNRYVVELGKTTKLSQNKRLEDELMLAVGVDRITIGTEQNKVYIEIPKSDVATATFTEVIKTKEFRESGNFKIPVGQNVKGDVIYGDITKFPHLLVAGTTGSGKSVFVNILICSLLLKNKPKDLELVLIDPKQVELKPYSNIKHLKVPIIKDSGEAFTALNYLVDEMERRYELISQYDVRNIQSFNKIADNKLSSIVVVIDEVADLMMSNREIEKPIVRLAQKARACGIYLIIATQKPSVNVLTGLIKSNVPSRISFCVASGKDSEVIIDEWGAENLNGEGDMYYKPVGKRKERLQGFFIEDEEIDEITSKFKEVKSTLDYKNQFKNIESEKEKYISNSPNNEKIYISDNETKELFVKFLKEYRNKNDENKNTILPYYGESIGNKGNQDSKNILSFDEYKNRILSEEKTKIFKDELSEQVLKQAIKENQISSTLIRKWCKVGSERALKILTELEEKQFISTSKSNSPREILITLEEYEKIKNAI